jgi:hypothetical protein
VSKLCLEIGIREKRAVAWHDDSRVEILNPVEQEATGDLRFSEGLNLDESEDRIPRCKNNIGGFGKDRFSIQAGLAKIDVI